MLDPLLAQWRPVASIENAVDRQPSKCLIPAREINKSAFYLLVGVLIGLQLLELGNVDPGCC